MSLQEFNSYQTKLVELNKKKYGLNEKDLK